MIVGITGVGTGSHNALVAIRAPDRGSINCVGRGTGRKTGGNQVGKSSLQIPDKGVAIQGLEQVSRSVADITHFKRRVFREPALNTQAPGLDFVWPKVGSDVGFSKGPRIKYASLYEG